MNNDGGKQQLCYFLSMFPQISHINFNMCLNVLIFIIGIIYSQNFCELEMKYQMQKHLEKF